MRKSEPDFNSLERVLRGEKEPEKVYFVELLIDEEMIKYVVEDIWTEQWIPLTEDTIQEHQEQFINFYYRMGYDCARMRGNPFWKNMPQFKERKTEDTHTLLLQLQKS